MDEPFYTSRSTIAIAGPLHRRARLEDGTTFEMGVRGPVVPFFRLSPPRELPLPVDYIVAATGG